MTAGELAEILSAAAGLCSVIVTLGIAVMVHDYTRRRDKAAIIHEMWRQQQDWNLQACSSPAHARATEMMVYGGDPTTESERHALRSCMFFFLNRVNHIYDAYSLKMLSWDEFEMEARANLTLLAGQKQLLNRLLDHRGYDRGFAITVKNLVAGMTPVERVDPPLA
jgi:hypothetical protein